MAPELGPGERERAEQDHDAGDDDRPLEDPLHAPERVAGHVRLGEEADAAALARDDVEQRLVAQVPRRRAGRPLTTLPPEMMSATPRATNETPRVTMNEGTPELGDDGAAVAPKIAGPTKRGREAGGHGDHWAAPASNRASMTSAETTELRPMTQPTDRSMPPEMITNVWPRPHEHHRGDGHQGDLGVPDGQEVDDPVGRDADADREERDEPGQEHPRPHPAHGEDDARRPASRDDGTVTGSAAASVTTGARVTRLMRRRGAPRAALAGASAMGARLSPGYW